MDSRLILRQAGCKFLIFAHHQSMIDAIHQFLQVVDGHENTMDVSQNQPRYSPAKQKKLNSYGSPTCSPAKQKILNSYSSPTSSPSKQKTLDCYLKRCSSDTADAEPKSKQPKN